MTDTPEPTVTLTLTVAQAAVVNKALDTYTRLGLGQLEILAELIGDGTIPCLDLHGNRQTPDWRKTQPSREAFQQVKQHIGLPANGNPGIGNKVVSESAHRAYEVHKVLAKVLAVHRNAPGYNVDHTGLTVRYTQDPAPVALINYVPEGTAA